MRRDTLIIIPAYNEEATIGKLLDQIISAGTLDFADVLVIDDYSGDQTGTIARARGVKTIRNVFNLGYGSAIQLGYKYAVRRHYDYVIQMDADGQHDVCNILKIRNTLLSPCDAEGNPPDIVIGSRFLKDSVSFPLPFIKKLAMGLFSNLLLIFSHVRICDTTSGLQGLNFEAFLYYSKYNNFNARYPDANMLMQMLLRGYRVVEFPAVMHQRETGVSMHTGIAKQITYMLLMTISILTVVMREHKLRRKRRAQGGSLDA